MVKRFSFYMAFGLSLDTVTSVDMVKVKCWGLERKAKNCFISFTLSQIGVQLLSSS
jgi:hypothetical protein